MVTFKIQKVIYYLSFFKLSLTNLTSIKISGICIVYNYDLSALLIFLWIVCITMISLIFY